MISSTAKSEDAVLLNQNEKAPYTGYLISKERAVELYKMGVQLQENVLLNESLTRSTEIYKKNDELSKQQLNVLLERNDLLSKQLLDTREVSTLEKTLWFIGGIVLSAGAVYGASKLAK